MWIGAAECFNRAVGMEHGRMVSPAKVTADFFEAVASEIAGQVHAYLAGEGNRTTALLALKICQADAVA